ncbi:ABC-type transport auxiliary lipoprotein family protein [Paraglaciecola aquimarina]|uniref:ABC-type transport auxiliary lipoprotein family protein n=1 Tax=Paraglaciecola aquimarina TaxID=1235557 RepID=A0ABU3SXJ2_9ALTE|nr:ABC-type transport auxiliary lipoprotein family protein [Paraglaciecola aquimarina]MDU0354730.1 ABC-type transport auxiliary lipoprotein family protein [Paraglaciecola aquimarina]
MKTLLTLLCACLLCACSSAPLHVHYYHLDMAQKPNNALEQSASETVLVLPIELAEYLQSSSLVMQIEQHQLYYSSNHMWAEQLSTGIYKSLLADLNSRGIAYFISNKTPQHKLANTHLKLIINHFHSTDTSKVLAAGRYSLFKKNHKQGMITKPFYFELELHKDGYAHSVQQLRNLITLIAEQIKAESGALLK